MAQSGRLQLSFIAGIVAGFELIIAIGIATASNAALSPNPPNGDCLNPIQLNMKSPIPIRDARYIPDGYDIVCGLSPFSCAPQAGCIPGYSIGYTNDYQGIKIAMKYHNGSSAKTGWISLTAENDTILYNNQIVAANKTAVILATNNTVVEYSSVHANSTIHVINLSNHLFSELQGVGQYPNSVRFYDGNIAYRIESNKVPLSELEKMALSIS